MITLRKITLWLLILSGLLTGLVFLSAIFLDQVPMWVTPIITLLTFLFALLHAGQNLGWNRAILLLVTVFVVSISFESIGVATGVIYGPYHYTAEMLGPKVFGLVPLLIPVAWFMMTYASFVLAVMIVPTRIIPKGLGWLGVAALSGVMMTSWDLAMDPLMVAGGHWVWHIEGPYFGVPLQNYWGWWLTTFTGVWIYQFIADKLPTGSDRGRKNIPLVWVVTAYALMGASSVGMEFIFGMDGPALVGIFAMLPWVLTGYLAVHRLFMRDGDASSI